MGVCTIGALYFGPTVHPARRAKGMSAAAKKRILPLEGFLRLHSNCSGIGFIFHSLEVSSDGWLGSRPRRLLVCFFPAQPQPVEIQVDDGRGIESQHLAEDE